MATEPIEIPGDTPPPDPAPIPEPSPVPAPADAPPADESFIDPRDLPEELKPHFKRMQASFTKKMQGLSGDREAVELVKKYRSDPDFARQVLQADAQRLGFTLTPAGATPPVSAPSGTPTADPPPTMVAAIRSRLAPELQWMAESLAAGVWESTRMTVEPLARQQAQTVQQTREAEFEGLAGALDEVAPTWREHEDDMNELLEFLQSRTLRHAKWGSKLELLHNLATGGAAAKARAITAMGEAARNRTTTGQPGRQTAPTLQQRVAKAKTSRDAFAVAAEEAEHELRRQGVALPT